MDKIKFYKIEWTEAEKAGKLQYAKECKEIYKRLVMKKITKPYHFTNDKLKMFPFINLN